MDTFKNLALTQIVTPPSPAASGTSVTVAPGTGAYLPPPPFTATVFDGTAYPTPVNAEIVRVTAMVGDTLTLVRAQEGTTARAILAGDYLAQTFTAQFVADVTNSSNQSAGILPDARLSPNVPRLNASNTFAASTRQELGTEMWLRSPGSPVDQRLWSFYAFADGQWYLSAYSDAGALLKHLMVLTRAGDLTLGGALSAPGGLNASEITTGTVPDARLSANVALRDAANTFIAPNNFRSQITLLDNAAPANARTWMVSSSNNGQLYFQAVTDDQSVQQGAVAFDRTGGIITTGYFDAARLSGTVPDARLSANVALKNIDNQFVAQTFASGCYVIGANTVLSFSATAAASGQKNWRFINYSDGLLRLEALSDDWQTILTGFWFSRTGGLVIGGDITEKSRTVPMGHWIDVPFNAANYSTPGGWTVTAGNVVTHAYTLIGKTMVMTFYLANTSLSPVVNSQFLQINLPAGFTIAKTGIGTLWWTAPTTTPINGVGFTYAAPGANYIYLYRGDQGAWNPQGPQNVFGTITLALT